MEAARLPDIVVADLDPRAFDDQQVAYSLHIYVSSQLICTALLRFQTAYMPSAPPIAHAPRELHPDPDWARNVVADFIELRQVCVHCHSKLHSD